jgi:sulfur carrier protein ThiS
MEPYTLARDFEKQDVIDGFKSCIWTERYYGDSDVIIVTSPTQDMISKLSVGTFLSINESEEIMIIETLNLEDGNLKASGIGILPWLNNRFIRISAAHEDRYWYMSGMPAGQILWEIIYAMCISGSPYLSGVVDIGIDNPEKLAIPNLLLRSYDMSGPTIEVGVPYGPIYDALREIATTFEVGMKITLEPLVEGSDLYLNFSSYKGLDHTSDQSINPVVRFSPTMDSFTDIKELQSIAALKTLVYAFAPGLTPAEGDPDLRTDPGVASLTGPQYTGFDLRALLVFADDITTDMVGGSSDNLLNVLNSRAQDALSNNRFIVTVDGEIVPDSQFQYGIHYNMGDIIEVQGNSGIIQTARITEYIRTQDNSGSRAYPTVTVIG